MLKDPFPKHVILSDHDPPQARAIGRNPQERTWMLVRVLQVDGINRNRPLRGSTRFSMTKQDFITEQQAGLAQSPKRWQVGFLIVYLGVLLGALILCLWGSGRLWVQVLCLAALVGCLPLVKRYARKRLGVRCPCCGKPLAGNDAQIALVSGYCWYCHKRVLV